MTEPKTELERLLALEYAGMDAAYADDTARKCPACGAIDPDERPRWFTDPDDRSEAWDEADGPRHAPDCWLATRIAQLQALGGDPEDLLEVLDRTLGHSNCYCAACQDAANRFYLCGGRERGIDSRA